MVNASESIPTRINIPSSWKIVIVQVDSFKLTIGDGNVENDNYERSKPTFMRVQFLFRNEW